MSAVTVLDASAIQAFLQGGPCEAMVRLALQSNRCGVTAANQSEVIEKSYIVEFKPKRSPQ
jgi:hypothetical protein